MLPAKSDRCITKPRLRLLTSNAISVQTFSTFKKSPNPTHEWSWLFGHRYLKLIPLIP